jgi:hypothetical protein
LKRLGLLPVLATLACAHVPPGSVARSAASVQVDGTRVEVRSGDDDPDVVDQVRRVLPQAVRAAAKWGPLPLSITVTLHATHAELEAATGRLGNPWMRAWARIGTVDLQSPRTWSRGNASDAAMGQILAHELTHCVLFQALGRDGRARGIPLWFQEGMASVAAGEHHSLARADAVTSPVPLLSTDPRLVYGTADRAFRDLVLRFGERRVRLLLERLGEGRDFPAAFRDATGTTVAEFERDLSRRLSAVTFDGG